MPPDFDKNDFDSDDFKTPPEKYDVLGDSENEIVESDESPAPSESEYFRSPQEKYDEEIIKSYEEEKSLHSDVLGIYKSDNLTLNLTNEINPNGFDVVLVPCSQKGELFQNSYTESILKYINDTYENFRFTNTDLNNLKKLGHASYVINNNSSIVFVAFPDRGSTDHELEKYIISALQEQINKRTVDSILISLAWNIRSKNQINHGFILDLLLSALVELKSRISNQVSVSLAPLNQLYGVDDEALKTIIQSLNFDVENNTSTGEKVEQQTLIKDKIDFSIDDPTLEDKLGRKPIAINLAKLIHHDIIGSEKCHAFMAHLQGRWGEGKTSFMKFLEEGLQQAGDNRWIVVHYNAWKNQNINPPWWTFLDTIYNQTKSKVGKQRFLEPWLFLSRREFFRRLNSGTILTLAFFLVFLIVILLSVQFAKSIFGEIIDAKLISTILTILIALFAISKNWSRFFMLNTPEQAQLFMKNSEDPTASIKEHFNLLISDITKRMNLVNKKKVSGLAVFIDDLDRCNAEYVVSLLEGIQTMFNDQKVFYLIAADKHWIAKSFEIVYEKYIDTAKKGTKLGYSFIEKNFQLSIRLPNPSDDNIAQYWKHLLKHEDVKPTIEEDKTSDTDGLENELNDISDVQDLVTGKFNATELSKKYGTDLVETQTRILERINRVDTSFAHILSKHHPLVGTNPRAVKRLANQYTTYRDILIVEQSEVEPFKLFRWVILQNRWPLFSDELEQNPSLMENPDEALKELELELEKAQIQNVIGTDATKLTQRDVEKFIGITTQQ